MRPFALLLLAALALVPWPTSAAYHEPCQRQTPPNGFFGLYTCDDTDDGTTDRYELRSSGTVLAVGYVAETATSRYVAYVHTYTPLDTYTAVGHECAGGWCYLAAHAASLQSVLVWHPEGSLTPINYCVGGPVSQCGTIDPPFEVYVRTP